MKGLEFRYHPTTPDGRYFVIRGRLWRCSNPTLDPDWRDLLVRELMSARRASHVAAKGSAAQASARAAVDAAKVALGERGPPWWTDGAPNFNQRIAKSTPMLSGSRAYRYPHEELEVRYAGAASTGCTTNLGREPTAAGEFLPVPFEETSTRKRTFDRADSVASLTPMATFDVGERLL